MYWILSQFLVLIVVEYEVLPFLLMLPSFLIIYYDIQFQGRAFGDQPSTPSSAASRKWQGDYENCIMHKGASATSKHKILMKGNHIDTWFMGEEALHVGRSMTSLKVTIFFRSSIVRAELPATPEEMSAGVLLVPFCRLEPLIPCKQRWLFTYQTICSKHYR